MRHVCVVQAGAAFTTPLSVTTFLDQPHQQYQHREQGRESMTLKGFITKIRPNQNHNRLFNARRRFKSFSLSSFSRLCMVSQQHQQQHQHQHQHQHQPQQHHNSSDHDPVSNSCSKPSPASPLSPLASTSQPNGTKPPDYGATPKGSFTPSNNSQPNNVTEDASANDTKMTTSDESSNTTNDDSATSTPTNTTTTTTTNSSSSSSNGQTDMRLIIAGVLIGTVMIGGGIAAIKGTINTQTFLSLAGWFESLGPNAIFLYATFYFILELIAVPALPLTLGAGYLFGVARGAIAVSISSTAAASAAFLIARYGLRGVVSNLASRYPRFRAMDRSIAREGFKFVFLLRLSPLLPFSISNYLYGLTSVKFLQFSIASWAGMLPGTIAYVSAGAAVNALTDLNSTQAKVNPGLLVIGAVATIAALTMVGRMASRAVSDVREEEEEDQESGLREF